MVGRRVCAVAVMIGLFLAACGDDETERFSTGKLVMADGLASLPSPGPQAERFEVTITDLDSAAAAMGVEALPDDADDDDALDWVTQLFDARLALSVPRIVPPGVESTVIRDGLGWTIYDVDSFAEVISGDDQFAVFAGDLAWTESAIEVSGGVRSIGEGDDGERVLDQRSEIMPLGRPIRVGQRDGLIVSSSGTATMQNWLDGNENPLDGIAPLKSAAQRLDAADAYTATYNFGTFQAETDGAVVPALTSDFDVVATGLSGEFASLELMVVYAFESNGDAESALDEVRDGWNGIDLDELVGTSEITTIEARADAVVVIVRVPNGNVAQQLTGVATERGLFTHS